MRILENCFYTYICDTRTCPHTQRHKVHTREEGAQRGTDIINCQNHIVKFTIITPKEICLMHSKHVSEVQQTYDIWHNSNQKEFFYLLSLLWTSSLYTLPNLNLSLLNLNWLFLVLTEDLTFFPDITYPFIQKYSFQQQEKLCSSMMKKRGYGSCQVYVKFKIGILFWRDCYPRMLKILFSTSEKLCISSLIEKG